MKKNLATRTPTTNATTAGELTKVALELNNDASLAVFKLRLQEMTEVLTHLELRGLKCCPESYLDPRSGWFRPSGLYIDHGGRCLILTPRKF